LRYWRSAYGQVNHHNPPTRDLTLTSSCAGSSDLGLPILATEGGYGSPHRSRDVRIRCTVITETSACSAITRGGQSASKPATIVLTFPFEHLGMLLHLTLVDTELYTPIAVASQRFLVGSALACKTNSTFENDSSAIGPGWTSFMPHIGDVVVEKLHNVCNPTFTVAAGSGQCIGVVTDDPIAIDLCNHVRVVICRCPGLELTRFKCRRMSLSPFLAMLSIMQHMLSYCTALYLATIWDSSNGANLTGRVNTYLRISARTCGWVTLHTMVRNGKYLLKRAKTDVTILRREATPSFFLVSRLLRVYLSQPT